MEYRRLYEDIGLGLTIWSPLSSGVLTGKYLENIPQGSRVQVAGMGWLKESAEDQNKKKQVRGLLKIAADLNCTPAQLAIAWCSKNPAVSTVITGASRPSQISENMKALEVLPKLTTEVMKKIEEIFPITAGD